MTRCFDTNSPVWTHEPRSYEVDNERQSQQRQKSAEDEAKRREWRKKITVDERVLREDD